MSVRTSTWRDNFASVDLQVSNFHNQFENSSLESDEIDKIHTTVKAAIKNLDDLVAQSKARYDEILKKRCCCSNRITSILWILNGVSKVCIIAGAVMAAASDSQPVKWWGVGVLSVGAVFELSGTVYGNTFSIDSDTMADFAEVNKQGIENAKAFERFIDRLKEVQALITQQLITPHAATPRPLSDRTSMHLNEENINRIIAACLQEYNTLPPLYRRDSTYGYLVSRLIQRLPPTDDLYRGLMDFETATTPMGMGSLAASAPLPIRYLPSPTESVADRENKGEQQAAPDEQAPSLERVKSEESSLREDYVRRWACYKDQLENRFGLKQSIPFLVTPNGCRVDRRGIQRTPSIKDLSRLPEASELVISDRTPTTVTTASKDHIVISVPSPLPSAPA